MPALPRTLFVGRGSGAVCWYRCALPAKALGLDWIGVVGEPGELGFVSGEYGQSIAEADFDGYDVVVLQQSRGRGWLRLIARLRARGVRVLYEIDDYVHAIRKAGDHGFKAIFSREEVREIELAMAACDGVICSTDNIARRYRRHNPNSFVCGNGIDPGRYALTLPAREQVTIGWAGGTGHANAVRPWLDVVARIMRDRSATGFVAIGQPFGDVLVEAFGEARVRSVPFHRLETYPGSMTLMDIAIAPAGRTNFYRGKSDLRWLESSALGIPLVADPELYPDIEPGVTGFHAATPQAAGQHLRALVDDPELRTRVGAAAREHVMRERDFRVTARAWEDVLCSVAGAAREAA